MTLADGKEESQSVAQSTNICQIRLCSVRRDSAIACARLNAVQLTIPWHIIARMDADVSLGHHL